MITPEAGMTKTGHPFQRTLRLVFNPGNQFVYGVLLTLMVVDHVPIHNRLYDVIGAALIGTAINYLSDWLRRREII